MGAESTKPGPRGGAPEAFPTETPAQPSTPSATNPSADGAQVVGARGYAPVFQGDVASGSGATPTTQPATFVPPPPLGREGTDGADASIDDLMPPLRTGFGDDWLL